MRLFLICLMFISCQDSKDLKNVELNNPAPLPQQDAPDDTQGELLPKCQDICLDDHRVLKGKNNNRDFLAFKNFGYRGIGRCRGHALVNQKVYELSNFRPDLKKNCHLVPLSAKCKELINKKINQLMNFKVVNFSGFNNLYEFSNHPEVKEILRSYVRSTSHRYRAVNANIRDRDLYQSQFEAIFNELFMRVKENQRPYIGIKGQGIGHHALIVHSYRYQNSQLQLCVHDSNIIFHNTSDQCQNYLYSTEGEVFYQRKNQDVSQLFIFSLTDDEDRRVAKYIKARYNHCIKSNRANNQCR